MFLILCQFERLGYHLPNNSSFFMCIVWAKTQSYQEFPYFRELIFVILIMHNKFSLFINNFSFTISFCIHINNA